MSDIFEANNPEGDRIIFDYSPSMGPRGYVRIKSADGRVLGIELTRNTMDNFVNMVDQDRSKLMCKPADPYAHKQDHCDCYNRGFTAGELKALARPFRVLRVMRSKGYSECAECRVPVIASPACHDEAVERKLFIACPKCGKATLASARHFGACDLPVMEFPIYD